MLKYVLLVSDLQSVIVDVPFRKKFCNDYKNYYVMFVDFICISSLIVLIFQREKGS